VAGWVKAAVERHAGRLFIMSPGAAAVASVIIAPSRYSDVALPIVMLIGAGLLVGGYLAPSLKEFVVDKTGLRLSTREPSERLEENREQTTEMTTGEEATIEDDPGELAAGARVLTAELALAQALDRETFHGCDLYMYLLDGTINRLRPFYGTSDRAASQPPWEIGQGAVGTAFELCDFVLVVGDDTTNATYGLNLDQQGEHGGLLAVAALPILNGSGIVIGVLSASDRSSGTYLATPEARKMLTLAAAVCARVLVDLLGLFTDDA
jgi:hypothetical protein